MSSFRVIKLYASTKDDSRIVLKNYFTYNIKLLPILINYFSFYTIKKCINCQTTIVLKSSLPQVSKPVIETLTLSIQRLVVRISVQMR